MITDLAVHVASGLWTAASKPSVVAVLVPVARDALLPAVVAFQLAWLGMRATFSTRSTAEFLGDFAELFVKAALIMAALMNWPDIARAILTAGEGIVSAIAPGQSSYGLVGNVMSYVRDVSDGQTAHSINTFTQLINGTFPDSNDVGAGSSLGLELAGGGSPSTPQGVAPLPTEGALLMQVGTVMMMSLGYALLSMILAVMVLVGCLVPMVMFTVAMALGPLVLPAYLLDNQLATELTEGWVEVLASSIVALIIIATLVAIVLPMVPPAPAVAATTSVESAKRAAEGFQTLLFAAALLSMPQAIAHGLLSGRVPAPPSLIGFILQILKLFPKTRALATVLGKK